MCTCFLGNRYSFQQSDYFGLAHKYLDIHPHTSMTIKTVLWLVAFCISDNIYRIFGLWYTNDKDHTYFPGLFQLSFQNCWLTQLMPRSCMSSPKWIGPSSETLPKAAASCFLWHSAFTSASKYSFAAGVWGSLTHLCDCKTALVDLMSYKLWLIKPEDGLKNIPGQGSSHKLQSQLFPTEVT